jgi:hypothetical protein
MVMNHNIFWTKYNALTNETVKQELMKNYMLGLKPSELDGFIFGNIAEIKRGIETAELTKEDRIDISNEVEKIVDLIQLTRLSKIAA